MKKKKFLIPLLVILILTLGVWRCTDIGLGYERITLHSHTSFVVSEDEEISFVPSSHHVVEYVVGRKHSRMTTAHGYQDRILIEFKEVPENLAGYCEVIQASRTGYRRGGPAVIRSLEDVWVEIRSCDDHFHIEGAIKLTPPAKGEPPRSRGYIDLVLISERKIKD